MTEMARLLIDGDWHYPIASESQFESDYEALIVSQADLLFPGCYLVPFKVPVESEEGCKIPDLVLIDSQYRQWWVVEIEMAHHSLERHVMPQVEVFSRGKYGSEHVAYLLNHSGSLDRASLENMLKGSQPRVLVIVNRSVPGWYEPIHRLNGMLVVIEVFRSSRNRYTLLANDDWPGVDPEHVITTCQVDNVIRTFLKINSPAGLPVAHGERVSIQLAGGVTVWTRIDISDSVWLQPTERNPLEANRSYSIVRNSNGELAFRPPNLHQEE